MKEVAVKAEASAEKKVVAVLSEMKKGERGELAKEVFDAKLLEELRAGKYDDTQIELEIARRAQEHGARAGRRGDQHRFHLRGNAPQKEKAPQDDASNRRCSRSSPRRAKS